MCVFTWLRVAEYSGLTGRKGTALRSVTRVLWFWVVSHTGDKNVKQKINLWVRVQTTRSPTSNHTQPIHPHIHRDINKVQRISYSAVLCVLLVVCLQVYPCYLPVCFSQKACSDFCPYWRKRREEKEKRERAKRRRETQEFSRHFLAPFSSPSFTQNILAFLFSSFSLLSSPCPSFHFLFLWRSLSLYQLHSHNFSSKVFTFF